MTISVLFCSSSKIIFPGIFSRVNLMPFFITPGAPVTTGSAIFYFLILVSYVGERPWWPVQSLNKGRKKKVKG